jgi:hypothetical protein
MPTTAIALLALALNPAADVVSALERPIAPRAGARCPDPARYALERPDAERGPTLVAVGLFFQDIASLSDVEQTLDADIYLVERWLDPRLADPGRGEGSADCPVPEGRLWRPALEPENLRLRLAFYQPRFLVDGRGVATYARRVWARLSYPLDFHDFPVDRHTWRITLWPVLADSDQLVFHPLTRLVGANDRLTIQGWSVGAPRASAGVGPRTPRPGTFARFDVVLPLDRDTSYYAWKLGLPLVLIVLMAYGVYFIPQTAVAQQIGLGMTAMMTLIAYMLTLGSTLPRISYLTRADRFFVGSSVLVFFGLVKAVVTIVLAQAPSAGVLERLDRWGRWLFPLAMLANLALAFLY